MENAWKKVELLVLDFDGVLTDGFVYVDKDGRETVRCSRRDSLGIGLIAENGVETVVISKEKDGVVAARCKKLGVECYHGIDDKLPLLEKVLEEKGVPPERACYMGDDINDIECIRHVGVGVATADAAEPVRDVANYVTRLAGGAHAVREVCDCIITYQ